MRFLLGILVFYVATVNGDDLSLIPRYCNNPRKIEINQCGHDLGTRIPDIYQLCVRTIRDDLKSLTDLDRFVCYEINKAEYSFMKSCFYGALRIYDKRGKKYTRIADLCLRKFEDQHMGQWYPSDHYEANKY